MDADQAVTPHHHGDSRSELVSSVSQARTVLSEARSCLDRVLAEAHASEKHAAEREQRLETLLEERRTMQERLRCLSGDMSLGTEERYKTSKDPLPTLPTPLEEEGSPSLATLMRRGGAMDDQSDCSHYLKRGVSFRVSATSLQGSSEAPYSVPPRSHTASVPPSQQGSRTLDDYDVAFKLYKEWEVNDTASNDTRSFVDPHDVHDYPQHARWDSQTSCDCDSEVNLPAEPESRCSLYHAPTSRRRLVWEVVGMPVLFYDLVTIPLQGVFKLGHSGFLQVMDGLTLLYWTLDIVASFTVGYVANDGHEEMAPRKIARHYVKGSFSMDLAIVAVDWAIVMMKEGASEFLDSVGMARMGKLLRAMRIIRIIRLLRLRKLRTIMQNIQDHIQSEYLQIMMTLAKNVFLILTINHFVACLWYWVGSQKITGYQSWVTVDDYDKGDWVYSYFTALHWSLTQFTPGSISVQPQNIPERIVNVIVLLFAMIIFSSFVSSVTSAMISLGNLSSKFSRDSWLLRRYMRQKCIKGELALRINRYVNIVLLPQMDHINHKDVHLLHKLSKPLSVELQAALYLPSYVRHPFLIIFARRSLIVMRKLCYVATQQSMLSQDDVLFSADEPADCLYILVEGTMLYKHRKSYETTLCSINEWFWFCEAVLWTHWVHKGEMRAQEVCELICLDAKQFREVIGRYHRDFAFVRQYASAFVKDLTELWMAEGSSSQATIGAQSLVSDLVNFNQPGRAVAKVLEEANNMFAIQNQNSNNSRGFRSIRGRVSLGRTASSLLRKAASRDSSFDPEGMAHLSTNSALFRGVIRSTTSSFFHHNVEAPGTGHHSTNSTQFRNGGIFSEPALAGGGHHSTNSAQFRYGGAPPEPVLAGTGHYSTNSLQFRNGAAPSEPPLTGTRSPRSPRPSTGAERVPLERGSRKPSRHPSRTSAGEHRATSMEEQKATASASQQATMPSWPQSI